MRFITSLTTWENWLQGLIGAAISGSGNAATLIIVDPTDFNFHAGLHKLLGIAALQALIGAFLYLKQKPLPEVKNEG